MGFNKTYIREMELEMELEKDLKKIFKRHDKGCNQKYGDKLPYSFHLKMVVAVGKRFIHILPTPVHDNVIRALAGHDLIEDGRWTFNDVKELFGELVAEMIYACTDEKGRDRDGRHSKKFYSELNEHRLGVYVKLCDVIANGSFSRIMGSSMFKKYQKDLPKMIKLLYREGEYEELWDELELILKFNPLSLKS